MSTELGRIAALSERVEREESPLEAQVRRVAWVIAAISIGAGLAFVPLGLVAGLGLADAASFAIGLIVANVPEGLLPTITLSLAIGVGLLARSGALVKRLSAIETLGSTTVICSDKTGTLTENRMRVTGVATTQGPLELGSDERLRAAVADDRAFAGLVRAAAACNNAELGRGSERPSGDPTEVALLELASSAGEDVSLGPRERRRLANVHAAAPAATATMATAMKARRTGRWCQHGYTDPRCGAIAQLGERLDRTQEVAARCR